MHLNDDSHDDDTVEFFPKLNNETVKIILDKYTNTQMIELNMFLLSNRIKY